MFAVLEVSEREITLKNRLIFRFAPPVPQVERIEIPNMFSFYKIKAESLGNELPWEEIIRAAGSLKSRMILPEDIHIKEEIEARRFEPSVFPLKVLMNSAISTLHTMALDPTRMCVSVVDENAVLIEKISRLVPLASTIRVVTENFFEYEKLAETLMKTYGISLVISSKVDESLFSSTVIICDKAENIPALFSGIVITNKKRRMMNATVLVPGGITLPPKFEALLPVGIDRLTFASALFELCAASELESMRFDKMVT